MELETVREMYSQGYDCAQAVIHVMAERVGYDEAAMMRATTCLGMGLLEGSVCGAVLAAYVIIGLVHGNEGPDMAAKGMALIKKEQFMTEFRKKYGSLDCPGLMGLDVRKAEDDLEAHRTGKYRDFCPSLCVDIVDILERIL
ncbi:MAG: C_GCAxxG_C_C family protein [Thermoplasmatales archaeon]|nr:C_GCAxxG_C_C family protein [Thermoplasmatales archaeon]